MVKTVFIGCIILLWLGIFVNADDDRITFLDDDDEDDSFTTSQRLDLDDMEYEQDNEGDTLIPQLRLSHDQQENYITIPDKEGEFQIMSRMAVHESRQNSSHYDAAKYVRFRFYSRANSSQSMELSLDDIESLPHDHGFNVLRPTMILIHGWLGSSESEVIEPLAKDFLEQDNFNVLAVDWEKGAQTLLYPVARYRVPKVGKLVAAVVDRLLDFGQTPDQIGIIGHSLGAHIAGLAGKNTRRKVACIVGLDPASPLFRLKKPAKRLSDKDAQYVEVIHTNGKALGIFASIGTADFYPNGGVKQPGCGWNISCSHQRAVDYFKESLKTRDYFADRCSDVKDLNSQCSLGKATLGGFSALRKRGKPRGVYYTRTAEKKPFLRSA
ncbi:lipase member H-A-like isoform X2 [Ochlerotatus camptorhynchus]|uniref:lipase member H-A-like isoform X2 n=1 Tax=Ochlerotatus camptorhynchus TaxID=644619 RepID=UPI0031CF7A16